MVHGILSHSWYLVALEIVFACFLSAVQFFNILVLFLEIIRWCPTIEHIISDGRLLIEQTKVHDNSMGPVSVLLEGKIKKEATMSHSYLYTSTGKVRFLPEDLELIMTVSQLFPA